MSATNRNDDNRWFLLMYAAAERGWAGDTADMIAIAVDILYSITTSLFYAIGVLRAFKWFFFLVRFIG